MLIENLNLRVESDDLAWEATGIPGIRIFPLCPSQIVRGADAPRDSTVLIRMEPGHGYPAHRHLDIEEVLILSGGYRDETGLHTAGSYLRYEPGSVHSPIASGEAARPAAADNPACVLFAVARGGIQRADRA